jgi:hypothetical protein
MCTILEYKHLSPTLDALYEEMKYFKTLKWILRHESLLLSQTTKIKQLKAQHKMQL